MLTPDEQPPVSGPRGLSLPFPGPILLNGLFHPSYLRRTLALLGWIFRLQLFRIPSIFPFSPANSRAFGWIYSTRRMPRRPSRRSWASCTPATSRRPRISARRPSPTTSWSRPLGTSGRHPKARRAPTKAMAVAKKQLSFGHIAGVVLFFPSSSESLKGCALAMSNPHVFLPALEDLVSVTTKKVALHLNPAGRRCGVPPLVPGT